MIALTKVGVDIRIDNVNTFAQRLICSHGVCAKHLIYFHTLKKLTLPIHA